MQNTAIPAPTHQRRIYRTTFLALLMLLLAACGGEATPTPVPLIPTPGMVTVVNTRAGLVPLAGGNGAIYLSVLNGTDAEVRLLYANSSSAPSTEFHESVHDHTTNVISMVPAPEGWVVPANSVLTLEPGGKHIMLNNVPEPLAAGDTVSLALTFDNGSVQILTVPVVEVGE